jgi:hypothetical protein
MFKHVPTYEKIFDNIDWAHKALGHAKCQRKTKNKIQSLRYSVPMSSVLLYFQTFPVCASSKKILKKKMNPLKLIISEWVGSRSQADLIETRSLEVKGMKWILRYVDCLSGFSEICCLPYMSSVVVAEAIV